jgi:hypothetical protein
MGRKATLEALESARGGGVTPKPEVSVLPGDSS